MAEELSGVAVIICIAFGVLTFLLLFIFANRQIKRFSLKSRSGPHVPTASDSTKSMQMEIERRIDSVKSISYQPKLLSREDEIIFSETERTNVSPLHLYRMKVLDSIHILEASIVSSDPTVASLFSKDLRLCLVRLFQKGSLHHIDVTVVHKFADLYDSARHEPGEFDFQSYVQFCQLQNQLLQSISPRRNISKIGNNNSHFASSSCSSSEAGKHLSNGKLSAPLPLPIDDEDDSNIGHANEEKKITYETSV